MSGCCEVGSCHLETLRKKQSQTLKIVLWINAIMFLVEFTFSLISHSTSLMADSLDMLGDALTYGLTLYVLFRSDRSRRIANYFKAFMMGIMSLFVFFQAYMRFTNNDQPLIFEMSTIGVMALLANLYCLYLLTRHKADDLNMKSVWICSRNDIVVNLGVLLSAFLVSVTKNNLPDIIIGSIIALVVLKSAISIVVETRKSITV